MTLSAKKKGRGHGEAGIAVSSTAASGTVYCVAGATSVVPQSLRGRKTKKMVLKLLRHARQAAQPQRTA